MRAGRFGEGRDVIEDAVVGLDIARFPHQFQKLVLGDDGLDAVGKLVAERAKAKGIDTVVFDRGGYIYHGRVAELAEGAREGGLEF